MAEPNLVVASLVLTFANPEAEQLDMTVVLTASTTASLQWGADTRTSSAALTHTFEALAAPAGRRVEYVFRAGAQTIARRLRPVRRAAGVRFGVVGDGGPARRGAGPREVIFARMRQAELDWFVAIGDPLGSCAGRSGPPAGRGRAGLDLTSRSPVVLVPRPAAAPADGPACPMPRDPLRDRFGLPPWVFHVRVGATLLMVLDPALGWGADGGQVGFMRAAVEAHRDARWRVAVMPAGPPSPTAGGLDPASSPLTALASTLSLDVVVSGQDRTYERRQLDRTAYVVTGASGARVDPRLRVLAETRVFIPVPHWVRIDFADDGGALRAYALEGTLLDAVDFPLEPVTARPVPWWRITAAVALLMVGLAAVAVGLLRVGRGPR